MGRSSRSKREGRPADQHERVVLWGVLMDGQLGNVLFPDMRTAEAEARRLRDEHPASTLEWAQVGITLLLRRPMRPRIERIEAALEHLVGPKP